MTNTEFEEPRTPEPREGELENFFTSIPTINLTKRLAEWKEPNSPFDGDSYYEGFFEKVVRGLHRQSPKNLLIRRERGVGDSVVVSELVRRALQGKYPHLSQSQFVQVDTRFTLPEDSQKTLIWLLSAFRDQPNSIVCIDGISSLLAPNFGNQNRQLLFSLLMRCRNRIIGFLNPQEYDEHFAGRPDADEFFASVELEEPGRNMAKRLVSHFAKGLSVQYGIDIGESAVECAVTLSANYIPNQRLPAKAVAILRDLCDDLAYERSLGNNGQVVTPILIQKRVSEISGIPIDTLAGVPDGVNYNEVLSNRILGQGQVIDEVATELGLIKAGMVDKGKPASVMLFVGATGTGKTELAKVLAKLYSASKRLKTFTLGNFSEPHSVSGLIGVPPGYVGHEQGGRLINELNSDPYSVFLLDEADKAHPDVIQPFLNLFDEGWIVDQRGVRGNAERAIFVLTTNVGQRQVAEMKRKGKTWDEIHAKLMESLSQIRHAKANRPVFTPEFLARIKRVIIFKPLDEAAILGITKQLCNDLRKKWLEERRKQLDIRDEVVDFVAKAAHEQNEKSKGKEGGRIVRKMIANMVESKLQSAIANSIDNYQKNKQIIVELRTSGDMNEIVVVYSPV